MSDNRQPMILPGFGNVSPIVVFVNPDEVDQKRELGWVKVRLKKTDTGSIPVQSRSGDGR